MPASPDEMMGVAAGAEHSRRVAWARYYKINDDNVKLLELNYRLMVQLAELCYLVTESEAVKVIEPEGPLALRTISIMGSLKRRAKGSRAITEAQRKYCPDETSSA